MTRQIGQDGPRAFKSPIEVPMRKTLIIAFLLTSFMLPMNIEAQTCEAAGGAGCYYVEPGGSGTSCSYASPCRFADAIPLLSAGDYLYLLDGEYGESEIPEEINGLYGASDAWITIRKYPDHEPTLFHRDTCTRNTMMSISNSFYVVFDGIAFKHDCYIDCGGTTTCVPELGKYQKLVAVADSSHITFLNSEFAGSTRYRTLAGIQLESSDYVTIQNNYIHDMTPPMGCETSVIGDAGLCCTSIDPSSNVCWQQSDGEAVFAVASDFLLIRDNVFEKCDHACISIQAGANAYVEPSKYARVINNRINARYGGGIYINENSSYCLVEGNVVTHAGGTTAKLKSGISSSGPNNTIRKNVIYSPDGTGFGIKANHDIFGEPFSPVNNLVYNNVIYGTGQGYAGSMTEPDPDDGGYGLDLLVTEYADVSLTDNTFANNIFYNSTGGTAYISTPSHPYEPELILDLGRAVDINDWLDEYAPGHDPSDTHWGGNKFHNNLIRKNSTDGESDADLIVWAGSPDDPGEQMYSIAAIQANDPEAWQGNIGSDPLIASEVASQDPDGYGLFDGWWTFGSDSPCVDKGTVIIDTNGAYVESIAPGYGWGNLEYAGSAPDIGAFELGLDDPDGLPCGYPEGCPSTFGNGGAHAGGCHVSLPGNQFGFAGFVLILIGAITFLYFRRRMKT